MFGQYVKVVAHYKTGEMLYKIAQKDYELKKKLGQFYLMDNKYS